MIVLPTYFVQDGWTPLYAASCYGHEQVVRVLLCKGASVNKPSNVSWRRRTEIQSSCIISYHMHPADSCLGIFAS